MVNSNSGIGIGIDYFGIGIGIGIDYFGIGIGIGIEVCYKKLNPQINIVNIIIISDCFHDLYQIFIIYHIISYQTYTLSQP